MKRPGFYIMATAIGVMIGLLLGSRPERTAQRVRIDTVRIAMPAAIDSAPARTVKAIVAKARAPSPSISPSVSLDEGPRDTIRIMERDSVEVELPIVSKEYGDSTYRAWVSGWMPSLDSIEVYPRTVALAAPKGRPKRWHLGATAGWAWTGKGSGPYVGIGVTYSFISF
ncbi:MAG: hypothetical protein NC102_11295 [Clostridium sp.]|nr:hypothetical protein [Clostridium sp.]